MSEIFPRQHYPLHFRTSNITSDANLHNYANVYRFSFPQKNHFTHSPYKQVDFVPFQNTNTKNNPCKQQAPTAEIQAMLHNASYGRSHHCGREDQTGVHLNERPQLRIIDMEGITVAHSDKPGISLETLVACVGIKITRQGSCETVGASQRDLQYSSLA